jgi:hypothetical protein
VLDLADVRKVDHAAVVKIDLRPAAREMELNAESE